jgi:LmbE family N-acetylglucosaminyl deacetylase
MTSLATLAFVHAHPDDEAFFGGGAVAYYASLGHRVVLVTCTRGQLGFDAKFRAGNEPDHDDLQTTMTRASELQHSAAILGFARVVNLGYDDSGMMGWPQNANPHAFMNAHPDDVGRTIASILDEEGVQVVVTYDEKGFYGHPDHIQANVVARNAIERSTSVQRLYYSVVPEGNIKKLIADATPLGLSLPAFVLDAGTHVADDLIATTMDVREYVKVKHQSMTAHASQIDNDDLVEMPDALFSLLFGIEYYQRAWSRHETSGDADELVGGL